MSDNQFKVFDTQTGEDVTGAEDWHIDSFGELLIYDSHAQMIRPDNPARYQVRRSTGISDKNGRVLFDGERAKAGHNLDPGVIEFFEGCYFLDFGHARVELRDMPALEYIEAES